METPTPLEQALRSVAEEREVSLGLPACGNGAEQSFPLTPEGAAQLVDRGFRVKMERGAAEHIHYSDEAYTRCGVEIVEHAEAFLSDIVVYLPTVSAADARMLRRGALLLTFMHTNDDAVQGLRALLERHVITIALDLIGDGEGHRPFADILHEIDGRAAIAIASSLLADAVHGKGILLGGVAGIVPCEVMIIGADIAAVAAGQSAIGLGAIVRIFDNDIYRLRTALQQLGPGAIGSSIHPRVFESALRAADIVVATDTAPRNVRIDADQMQLMKRGVLSFDLSSDPGHVFPAMPVVDLDLASPSDSRPSSPVRLCYINAGDAVPRTIAMALSNTFVNMLDQLLVADGVANALKLNGGLRQGAVTFLGKCVNPHAAKALGIRPVDISLFLQFT